MENITWVIAPQLIINSATSNIQDAPLTESSANILNSGTHGRRCFEYHVGINEVLNMRELFNHNAVSLCSAGFAFLMNHNSSVEDRYFHIFSNMLQFPVKVILSANQVHAADHLYDDKGKNDWLPVISGKSVCLSMVD